ncbi:hypothetical protein H8959_007910 [Pygathrix nigripes]
MPVCNSTFLYKDSNICHSPRTHSRQLLSLAVLQERWRRQTQTGVKAASPLASGWRTPYGLMRVVEELLEGLRAMAENRETSLCEPPETPTAGPAAPPSTPTTLADGGGS